MRILIVSQMYPRPDAPTFARFISRQATALAEAGARVHVVAPMQASPWPLWGHARWRRHGMVPRREAADGMRIERTRYWSMPGMRFHFVEGHTMRRALLGERLPEVDVIHANRLFPEGFAALALGRKLGVPVVCMARGMDLNLIPAWGAVYRRLLRTVIGEADGLLSVSHALVADLRRLAEPPRPVTVVYNGVDSQPALRPEERIAVRRRYGIPESAVLACYAGRLEPDKGTPELLRAFSAAARRVAGLHLAAVGSVRAATYPLDVQRAGLSGRVTLLGERPGAAVRELMGAADIFVFPSRVEGVPNAVLEAMSAGLPVVATRAGGTAEILPPEAGRLVAVGDVRGIEEHIVALARDAALRRRMGQAGRRHAAARFTWRSNADALLSYYSGLATPERPARLAA